MSLYCFIAGEKKIPPLSIGVVDQGYRIIIEDEKHTLLIFEDLSNSYTKAFTDKPVIMGLQIGMDFATVEEDLLSYLQQAMVDNSNIEIWRTWMGETGGTEYKSVHINELSVEDLRWALGEMVYTHPKCLKVYKWTKGKR